LVFLYGTGQFLFFIFISILLIKRQAPVVLWTQSSLLNVEWCDHAGVFHMRVKCQPITEWTAYYEARYNLEHYT